MIDYEKLNKAQKLILKLNKAYILHITQFFSKNRMAISLNSESDDDDYDFESIDELITKLQELSQLKTRYEIGQWVFFMMDGILCKGCIHTINDGYEVTGYIGVFEEDDLHPSRESLIQSQIDYWQDQLTKEHIKSYEKSSLDIVNEHLKDRVVKLEFKECQHDPDLTGISCLTHPVQNYMKCKKCGEFYK